MTSLRMLRLVPEAPRSVHQFPKPGSRRSTTNLRTARFPELKRTTCEDKMLSLTRSQLHQKQPHPTMPYQPPKSALPQPS